MNKKIKVHITFHSNNSLVKVISAISLLNLSGAAHVRALDVIDWDNQGG